MFEYVMDSGFCVKPFNFSPQSNPKLCIVCFSCLSQPPFQWWYRAELLSLWTTLCATQSIINIVEDIILTHSFTATAAAVDSSHVRHCKIVGNPICGDKTHVSIACTHSRTHSFIYGSMNAYLHFFIYVMNIRAPLSRERERKN